MRRMEHPPYFVALLAICRWPHSIPQVIPQRRHTPQQVAQIGFVAKPAGIIFTVKRGAAGPAQQRSRRFCSPVTMYGMASQAEEGTKCQTVSTTAVERHLSKWRNDQHIADEPAHCVSSLRSPRVAI